MWPMFVDYSEEECKRVLRSLELEAYSSIINAFRAQGNLTKDRKKMLQDLCSALSISMERHRAEVRRAVNDEHLNTIAERLFGPNNSTDWAIEGRRVVPLMQRLAPQTVFSEIATSAASAQVAKNVTLPLPGKTGDKDINNGIETMASRKRRDLSSDWCDSPYKMSAMDSQYFHNVPPFDSACSSMSDPSQVPETPISSETFSLSESNQVSSLINLNAPRSVAPVPMMTNPMSTASSSKSTSKHPLLKPTTTTVTTFSSIDQMTSNLLVSRGVPQGSGATYEEQSSNTFEVAKPTFDLKSAQRSLSSIGSMKSSTIVIPTSVSTSCSASTSKDRVPTPPLTSSQNSKFLTQIRSKNSGQTRQNVPAGLGIKLNPQSPISQRATASSKSPMKVKQDNISVFKKSSSTFPSTSSENMLTQFPVSCSSESTTPTKSPISVTKSNPKPELQTTSKQTALAKSLPKTTAQSSQYISRSLFSTSNKSGAKNLSP